MKTTLVKTLIAAGIVSAPALLLAQTSTTPVPQAGTNAPAAQTEQPNTPSTTTDAANRDAANPSATNPNTTNVNPNAATGTNQPNSSGSAATSGSAAAGMNADISASTREQFTQLDANSDGGLSQEEYAKHSPSRTDAERDASSSTTAGRNGTGAGLPGTTAGSTGGLTGANNDTDREDQKPMSSEERFRQLDANNDGKLSVEEFNRSSAPMIDETRDASSSTTTGRNGTGPGTPGSTTGSTGASTSDVTDDNDNKRPE